MTRLVFDRALCVDQDSLRDVILAFSEGLRAHTRFVVAPQRPDTSSAVERSAMNSRGERYPSALCARDREAAAGGRQAQGGA